jgi:hypothetical protein
MASLTKPQIAQIRTDIMSALAAVTAKHGVDFSLGTIRFGADTFGGKLSGVVRGAAGTSTTAPVDLKALALAKTGKRLLGQNYSDTAKYHSLSLGTVRFVGYNSRAKAYPFIVATTGGKRYKITTMSAQSLVNAGAVA